MTEMFAAAALLQQADRTEVTLLWGVLVPAAVLSVAFIATYLLYRHFVEQTGGGGGAGDR